jgi:hypothetical protein
MRGLLLNTAAAPSPQTPGFRIRPIEVKIFLDEHG